MKRCEKQTRHGRVRIEKVKRDKSQIQNMMIWAVPTGPSGALCAIASVRRPCAAAAKIAELDILERNCEFLLLLPQAALVDRTRVNSTPGIKHL